VCNAGKLGCDVCRRVAALDSHGHNLLLSPEWSECTVTAYGDCTNKMQTSLRKKICKHKNSDVHKAAEALLHSRAANEILFSVARQREQDMEATCKVFRTAYYVAQSDRPYSDHPDLISLQQANGINLGRLLHSNVSCTDIIDHISSQMRHTLINKICANKFHISVLIDESTNLNRLSCLVVYVRATVDIDVGPVTFFLDLVELQATDANAIVAALMHCLVSHGFSEEFLKEFWVGLAVDGASVMLGNKCGVATQLKAKFPALVTWHCFNHRLELAVADAIKCTTQVNHFKIFMDTLYSLYSQSPKCQRELGECAAALEQHLNRIGRVLSVRWVASSCRTVLAVWKSYPALHEQFVRKSQDSSLDSREKSKFAGLARKFESPIFVKNLGLMLDALEELSDLSLALQRADVTLSVATKLISKQVLLFTARKESDSEYYTESCEAVASGEFKGVKLLTTDGKLPEIPKGQFYQALADSVAARLLPDKEKDLVRAIDALNPASFPDDLSPEYGESEIRLLCTKFGLAFRDLKFAFREYRDSRGNAIAPCVRVMLNCVNTIPVSTSECERGFSKMNVVCSSLRTRLTVPHIMSSLIFVSLCCPPVHLWEPLKFVKSWIALNRRSADCTQGLKRVVAPPAASTAMKALWDAM